VGVDAPDEEAEEAEEADDVMLADLLAGTSVMIKAVEIDVGFAEL